MAYILNGENMEKDKYGAITLNPGERNGKLTVIKKIRKTKSGRYWLCQCDCGENKEISSSNFIRGSGVNGCKSCIRNIAYNRKYAGELGGLYWCHIKAAAKSRNIEFNITIEEAWELFLKQNRKCSLSGLELKMQYWNHKKKGRNKTEKGTASLDRIDSKKSYCIENCQWVHKDINWIKNKLDQNYFIYLCGIITDYSRNKCQ